MIIPAAKCPAVFCHRGRKTTGVPREKNALWYVGQVKSNREKIFAHSLRAHGVSYFLPMQEVDFRNGGSLVRGMKLILPGFVFFLANTDDYYRAQETRHLWGILKTDDQRGLVADLRRLGEVVKTLRFICLDSIQPGRRVRVREGHALAGMEAKVDFRHGNRVRLDIPLISVASVFEIDAKFLEVLP